MRTKYATIMYYICEDLEMRMFETFYHKNRHFQLDLKTLKNIHMMCAQISIHLCAIPICIFYALSYNSLSLYVSLSLHIRKYIH